MIPKTIKQTLDQIDSEILFHETRLLALKSQRNSLIPILNLPLEIIGRIIRRTQLTGGQELHTHPEFLEFKINEKWRRIMLVCRQFRTVALTLPELWTFISTQDADWMHISLERAKSLPLILDLRPPSHNHLAEQVLTKLLLANFSRAYAVSLSLGMRSTDQIQAFFDTPAPWLNTLQWVGTLLDKNILNMLPGFSNQLVELSFLQVDLKEGRALACPRLQRLRLDTVSITPGAFFPFLSNMISLEHLVIRHMQLSSGLPVGLMTSREATPDLLVPQDRSKCVLRHLCRIFLQAEPFICRALLQILHPSRHACQTLNLDIVDDRMYCEPNDNVDNLIVEVFEFATKEWVHLFAKPLRPLSPATLIVNIDGNDYAHSFTPIASRGSRPELASTIAGLYVPSLSHRYEALGVHFEAVQIQDVVSPGHWAAELPELTRYWNICASNATRLILKNCWNYTGLCEWLIERKQTSHFITTLELVHSARRNIEDDQFWEAEKLRSNCGVTVVTRIINT